MAGNHVRLAQLLHYITDSKPGLRCLPLPSLKSPRYTFYRQEDFAIWRIHFAYEWRTYIPVSSFPPRLSCLFTRCPEVSPPLAPPRASQLAQPGTGRGEGEGIVHLIQNFTPHVTQLFFFFLLLFRRFPFTLLGWEAGESCGKPELPEVDELWMIGIKGGWVGLMGLVDIL
jgi:hypothetical protein